MRLSKFTVRLLTEGAKKKAAQEWRSKSQAETIDGWPADAAWGDLATEVRELAKSNGLSGTSFRFESSKEKLRQLVREQMPARVTKGAVEWTEDGFSIPAALAQALPQAQLIPAVRDAAADGEPGKTSFGSLLKSIVMPAVAASTEFKAILDAVKLLEKRLRGRRVRSRSTRFGSWRRRSLRSSQI